MVKLPALSSTFDRRRVLRASAMLVIAGALSSVSPVFTTSPPLEAKKTPPAKPAIVLPVASPAPRDPQAVRADAERILRDPLFKPLPPRKPNPHWETIARLIERFGKMLERLFSFGGRISPLTARAITYSVLGLLSILLIALTVWAIIKFRLFPQGRKRAGETAIEEGEEDVFQLDLPPQQWLERARTLASESRFREAIRAVYIAVLLNLEGAGVIKRLPQATNWDYARQLQSNRSDLLPIFRPLTQSFDLFWYGERPVERADFERFEQAFSQIDSTISNRGKTV